MSIPLVFRNLFHIGYVVRDVDKAIETMRGKFGISKWHILRMPAGAACTALGFAYVNDVMIELIGIDPKQETPPIFQGWMPKCDSELRFNHIAHLVDSGDEWRAIRARFASAGISEAVSGTFGELLHYFYADTVEQLGHYSEFCLLMPAGKEFFANVPRN